jgi:DNA repair exonuclease SbcCD ATPase subunit
MLFGFRNKDIKELEGRLENRIMQEREKLVDIFISAKNGLMADNKITIARGIEEAKQELGENVNVKVENGLYEKTKEYENNLKKITDKYLNKLKENTDNYLSLVLIQYQSMIDEAKNTAQEFKSLLEESKQYYQDLENKVEELKKASKTEEIAKIFDYKQEIGSKLDEIKAFYGEKDRQYMAIVDSSKKSIEKIEKDYIAQQKRLEEQLEELDKLIAEKNK